MNRPSPDHPLPPAPAAAPDPPAPPSPHARALSYRAGLMIWISLLVLAIGLVLSGLAFREARVAGTAAALTRFQEVSDHAVTKTREFVLRAVPIAQAVGNLSGLGLATGDPDKLARQLTAVLRAHPGVTWVSFSDEAGAFVGAYRTPDGALRVNQSRIQQNGRTLMLEFDVLPDDSWRPYRREDDSGYDPRKRPFYARAKSAGRLVWPPPYIFYEQGVPGVTCANPVYDGAGKLRGVLTVDFDLNTLSKFARQLTVSPNSRLFIMSAEGVLLAHPTQRPGVRPGGRERGELKTVRDIGDPLVAAFDAQLTPEDRKPALGGQDYARQFAFTENGAEYFARTTAFAIDPETTWIVGAIAPQSDFLAAARRSSLLSLAASLAAVLVAMGVAVVLARRVSGPVVALTRAVRRIGDGDLDVRADLGGAREFRELSDALNSMTADLRDRARLRAHLAMATQVQQKLLPARPPALPGLDVFGFSTYCDETGGDYFDYLIPDADDPGGRVIFAVGDVMGHGIASALTMAAARATLRSRARDERDLGQMLSDVNAQLVPDMGGRGFVTMLLWAISPDRRTAQWTNAGHDPAILYDPESDTFDEAGYDGIPLGIDEAAPFGQQDYERPLRPGHVILLGTDGIWDTTEPGGDFYGKDRPRAICRAHARRSAQDIALAIRADLDAFRAGGHQRDDVTLVVIKVL